MRTAVAFLLLAGVWLVGVGGRAADAPTGRPKATSEKPRPKITISKETTRITGPLRADGYVDYVAALNEHCSKGVTPENNAAVLLWQAFGPKEIKPEDRQQFFQMLAMEPLAEQGDYLISLYDYAEELPQFKKTLDSQPAWEALQRTGERPWQATEMPVIAGWLEKNEKPLALVIAASKRPRYYAPLLPDREMTASLLPGISPLRNACRMLLARAMLRLGEGKTQEAWQDVLACHRLGRLCGQGPWTVDELLAGALGGMACTGDVAIAHHGSLSAAQAHTLEANLRGLTLPRRLADTIDVGERYFYLDNVASMARDGPSVQLRWWLQLVHQLSHPGREPRWEVRLMDEVMFTAVDLAAALFVDWDEPLRMGNQWCDRIVDAGRKSSHAKRKVALAKVEADLREQSRRCRDPWTIVCRALMAPPRKAAGQIVGQYLVDLFVPEVNAMYVAEDRAAVRLSLSRLALALAGYRADHGAFPARLQDLTPTYLDELPKDLFSDADFIYKPQHGGYLLYSVGRNGEDDGGHDRSLSGTGPTGDDIVIRYPPKGKP